MMMQQGKDGLCFQGSEASSFVELCFGLSQAVKPLQAGPGDGLMGRSPLWDEAVPWGAHSLAQNPAPSALMGQVTYLFIPER